jgi:hypothetical protein
MEDIGESLERGEFPLSQQIPVNEFHPFAA